MVEDCTPHELDFIIRDTDPEMAAVEDNIREGLARIGIDVKTHFLNASEYIEAERDGSYNMLFSRTWGAPYDPHSYLTSWEVPAHVEYSAIGNLSPPLTRDDLLEKIAKVQGELNIDTRQDKWSEILDDIHQQAIFVPLWGSRAPFVINRRLDGFVPPPTGFGYPLTTVRVVTGSKTVTVAPGSSGALFKSIGPMNPHQYSPNQLFVNQWIYEGLVRYEAGGEIAPALATSWVEQGLSNGGQRVIFTLRDGVKFHDGSDWNCDVAKLNFDHILSDTVRQRHSWYGTPQHLTNWECSADDEFIVETDEPFYPLLQELTYLRPLVFASPAAFAEGLDSDPDLHNSCNPGDFGSKWDHLEDTVVCLGLKGPWGTGPFQYTSRTPLEGSDGAIDDNAIFTRFEDYWGIVPEIEVIKVQHYDHQDDIFAALRDGSLDMALGLGPLTSTQVRELQLQNSTNLDILRSEVLQNTAVVLNTNRTPTDDINVRKAIIHAIDKNTFIKEEFGGLETPVTQLLPLTAPYCNIDLSPQWDQDLEKAMLLNCGGAQVMSAEGSGGNDLSNGAIAGIVIASVVGVALFGLVMNLIEREKAGKPMFQPTSNNMS